MKYFKIFNTEAEYLEYAASFDFLTPNVSTLRDCTHTWITAEQHRYIEDYFTVESLEDNNTITFTRTTGGGDIASYFVDVSTDDGETWETVEIPFIQQVNDIVTLNTGEKALFKFSSGGRLCRDAQSCMFIGSDQDFKVYGNVMSLSRTDFTGNTTAWDNEFVNLFSGSTHLVSAENLIIPSTSTDFHCYCNMFKGCTSLEYPPSIYATNMSTGACEYMFSGCTSLLKVPSMRTTEFSGHVAYRGMFEGCTSLTTVPLNYLPVTSVTAQEYESMFNGCTSLRTAPELPAATFRGRGCYYKMFSGCTSLVTPPSTLPSTTLTNECYKNMFSDCTSLTTVPAISATTLASECYRGMFDGCTSLTTAPNDYLPVTTLSSMCYRAMFANCSNLESSPELPATTLADGCYRAMFANCSLLTSVPSELPVTTLADSCYQEMFFNCSNLTTAPELPATTLANYCYAGMFKGCSSLTTAPELPAATLLERCYNRMFSGCTSLTYVKCLATNISANECTLQWLSDVPSEGTFVKSSTMEDWVYCNVSNIPCNWDVHNDSSVAVTGVTLNTGTTTVDKGNTYTLTATVLPVNADVQTVTWSTSDSSVATVANGVITGVGCGNATITVTTDEGGYTAQCIATVENHVTGVDINTVVVYISSGGTYQLEETVSPSDACDKSVSWSSSDSSIVSVDSTGLVSGVTTGSATVTVTTVDGGYSKGCAVTVNPPVHASSVTLSDSAITISENSRYTLTATVLPSDAVDKSVTWTSSNSGVATVDSNGLVSGVTSGSATITVTTVDGGYTASCNVTVEEVTFTTMVIEGASNVSAETCQYRAICDNIEDVTSSATWSITAGSQYATINSSNGQVTILNGANESSVTIQAEYAGLTATTTVTLTYLSGATSETTSVITTDIGGNATSVVTTVTEYEDGSSTEVSETIVTDANGDLVGSSETTKNTNADGSYNGVTTNYDANGDPVNGSNVTGDTAGNVSTQTVEYDESGNTVVTGYDIDTSGSESGKTFNHDGVNTDYYAFDVTHGFVLDFDFTMDLNNQPAAQDGNHHNVLNAKRATPEPWYGFQIRHSSSVANTVFLGVQFSGGSNENVALVETSTTGSVKTYNLRIVYDPTSTGTTFTCINTATQYTIFSSSLLFPDIEELKNLKVTIGYAVNGSGNPYRYSNITVHNFELKKLKNVANPTITCENNEVSIGCSTVGASVYYRLNLHGDYSAYTTSFAITADTVVQAYATYSGDTSDIIRKDCEYGLEKPVISCDGEEVTITCVNTGVTIYYRLNESGTYSAYTTPIPITADTVVEAYSQLGEETSVVVKETCLANVSVTGVTLNENSITINRFETYTLSATVLPSNATNKNVTWSSSNANVATVDSNGVVSSVASGSAIITVTTVDGSYTAQCSVSVTNRYAYFTLVSLADNNTFTLTNGSTAARNLSYSLDDGTTWSSFSLANGATQTIATINSGDTIIMKGSNTQLANEYNKGCYFRGTQNYEVEGNISSLLNNNDTDTEITGGTFHFAQMFSGDTHLISAENLKVVSTILYKSSFNGTFRSCTNLQKAPDLSIPTTLDQETYSSMFEACTSMSQPPTVLSATTAQLSSYKRMFCMNRSNTVTTQMTKSPIMIGNFGSENSVAKDYEVFKGNGSLTEVKCYWTNTSGSFSGLASWMTNVSSSGTFYKRSAQTFSLNSANGIPSGWDIVNDDTTGN